MTITMLLASLNSCTNPWIYLSFVGNLSMSALTPACTDVCCRRLGDRLCCCFSCCCPSSSCRHCCSGRGFEQANSLSSTRRGQRTVAMTSFLRRDDVRDTYSPGSVAMTSSMRQNPHRSPEVIANNCIEGGRQIENVEILRSLTRPLSPVDSEPTVNGGRHDCGGELGQRPTT